MEDLADYSFCCSYGFRDLTLEEALGIDCSYVGDILGLTTIDLDHMRCLRHILGVDRQMWESQLRCKSIRPTVGECAYCLLTTWDVEACCGARVTCLPTFGQGPSPSLPVAIRRWEVAYLWGGEGSLYVCDTSLPTLVEYLRCFFKAWDTDVCRSRSRCFYLEFAPESGIYRH